MNIHIIYYIGTVFNINWITWLIGALILIKNIKYTSTHLFVYIKRGNEDLIYNIINSFELKNININFRYKNEHEYVPLKNLWHLSREFNNHDDYFLYFHSKYITSNNHYNSNIKQLKIIKEWENIIKIFETHSFINKIGTHCSNTGFCWYNLFWVRGSYLYKIEKPVLTDRRHYYEDWLARNVVQEKIKIYCDMNILENGKVKINIYPKLHINSLISINERKKIYQKTYKDCYNYIVPDLIYHTHSFWDAKRNTWTHAK